MTNLFKGKSLHKLSSHSPSHRSNFRLFHRGVQTLEIRIEISILFDHIANSTSRETRKILFFFFTITSEFEVN